MKQVLILQLVWIAIENTGRDHVDAAIDQRDLALICSHVAPHHFATLSSVKTAKEAWDKLAKIHKERSEARKSVLMTELLHLRKEGNEDITTYINRAKGIRNALISAGEEASSINIITPVLNGLPPLFLPIRMAFLAQKTMPTIDDLHSQLLGAEQLALQQEHSASTSMAAFSARSGRGPPKAGPVCYFCQKIGHVVKECKKLRALQEKAGIKPAEKPAILF